MGAMNSKGAFTRDRRPKMAAHRLRELRTKLLAFSEERIQELGCRI